MNKQTTILALGMWALSPLAAGGPIVHAEGPARHKTPGTPAVTASVPAPEASSPTVVPAEGQAAAGLATPKNVALYVWHNPLVHPANVWISSSKGLESSDAVGSRGVGRWKLDKNFPHQIQVVFTFLPPGVPIQALDSQGLPIPVVIDGVLGDATYDVKYDFAAEDWTTTVVSAPLVRESSVESVRNNVLMIYQHAVEWNKSAATSIATAGPATMTPPVATVTTVATPTPIATASAPTTQGVVVAMTPTDTPTTAPVSRAVEAPVSVTIPATATTQSHPTPEPPAAFNVLESDLLRQNSPRGFEVNIQEVGLHDPATPGVLHEGETIECTVVANRDCYITIIGISQHAANPRERFVLLYPNHFQPDQLVKAGQVLHLPGLGPDGDPLFIWRVRPPLGVDFVKVFATLTPPRMVDDNGKQIDRSAVPLSQTVAGLDKGIGVEAPEPRIFSPKLAKQFDDQSWSTHTIQLKSVPAEHHD